jgi:hypothetical protein
MNPQTGEVAVGHSIRNGNTTYHSGPGYLDYPTQSGGTTRHTFTRSPNR